jgi:hypothetical protein
MMRPASSDSARIFLSVASFCDPMLMFTLRSALETARYPGRLSFGIVDQALASVEADLPDGAGRTAYVLIDPHHSRGVCWARSLAMSLYTGEDYFLQIDSHSLFEEGWDVTLIEAYEAVTARSGSGKTILSTRPFAFEVGENGSITTKRFTKSTIRLVPKGSLVVRLDEPVMMFSAYNSNSEEDLPGFQISAAFLFAPGRLVEEVPYDPHFYFHGEEQNMSIRAFTHGWDIWHPNKVPLYHLYKTRMSGEAPLHWDAQFEARRSETWLSLRTSAHRRLTDLLEDKLQGAYRLGSVRSVDDYLRFAGLTLEARSNIQTAGVQMTASAAQ